MKDGVFKIGDMGLVTVIKASPHEVCRRTMRAGLWDMVLSVPLKINAHGHRLDVVKEALKQSNWKEIGVMVQQRVSPVRLGY